MATFFPMSSDSLNLSGLVSAQIVRFLKSEAFCITRFIALSPVGSPTSETMTIMLLVFFRCIPKLDLESRCSCVDRRWRNERREGPPR